VIDIGLAWTLTLVSAYLVGSSVPDLPEEQGAFGMTDDQLYTQIRDGDPLGNMTFGEAVAKDPRRIEGLILQRVVQPFTLALTKLENPNLSTQAIQDAMRHAYLERNHRMRSDGHGITAQKIADANKRAWKMNSDVLQASMEMSHPEAIVLKQLMTLNQKDIQRAFREAREIAAQASTEATTDACVDAWRQVYNVLSNMDDLIGRYIGTESDAEVIDDEIHWIQPAQIEEKMGAADGEDLFGALSFDNALADHEEMGAYEYEEYIVTGHRAPAVGLAAYRRSGGRVF
jgi:hypothetical protein